MFQPLDFEGHLYPYQTHSCFKKYPQSWRFSLTKWGVDEPPFSRGQTMPQNGGIPHVHQFSATPNYCWSCMPWYAHVSSTIMVSYNWLNHVKSPKISQEFPRYPHKIIETHWDSLHHGSPALRVRQGDRMDASRLWNLLKSAMPCCLTIW